MTAPDYPQTRLAFRCWQLDTASMVVRSLNEPSRRNGSWIGKAMAGPEGGWPPGEMLHAACAIAARPAKRKKKGDEDAAPAHGALPEPDCTCGIYATTSLDVINLYLSQRAPVLGIVEMGGRVIPAEQGFRAAAARLAVILLPDVALTEPHRVLRDLAAAYRVPAAYPHSLDPEDYRELAAQRSVAAEAEEWLRDGGAA